MKGTESRTSSVEGNRDAIAARLRGGEAVLVGLDFDGTLAPLHDDPAVPEITPDCRAALEALAERPGVVVGVFSGRELSDLKPRVGIDGILYAGNHGLELERDGNEVSHPVAARRRPVVRDVVADVADRLGDVPGCEIEDKELTVSVHYRRVPRPYVDEVRSAVNAVVSGGGDTLRVTEGKDVIEIRPSIDWGKGSATLYVAEHLARDHRILYVGDDVTDEDAFAVLGDEDVGVHVGDRRETLADYRLASQSDVAPFLEWLATDVVGPPE